MDRTDDKKAIREVVERWMKATRENDLDTVLSLMTDDVVFMVPGREPFGKEAFAAASKGRSGVKVEGIVETLEIGVFGDRAWIQNHSDCGHAAKRRSAEKSGYTLSVFRKENGKWLLARDANLVTYAHDRHSSNFAGTHHARHDGH
jgi:uncharacterized protein (TIGR02246 family)